MKFFHRFSELSAMASAGRIGPLSEPLKGKKKCGRKKKKKKKNREAKNPKKKMKKRPSNLLDLDDALLLKILERLEDVSMIVKLGGVNKRLRSLIHLPRRLKLRISDSLCLPPGPSEMDLLHYFMAARARGANIQHLSVFYQVEVFNRPFLTSFILPLRETLQSLEIELVSFDRGEPEPVFFSAISSCTNLVSLRISCTGPGYVEFSSPSIAQVVAFCSKLRVLIIEGEELGDLDELLLVSSSLEELEISVTEGSFTALALCLMTPRLAELRVLGARYLEIRAHALRKLRLGVFLEFKVESLAGLEYLEIEQGWCLPRIREVLTKVSDGCLDKLVVKHSIREDFELMNMEEFLKPLKKLRSFVIGSVLIKTFAQCPVFNEKQMLGRLGVEELVVEMDVLLFEGNAIYQHLLIVNTMGLLESLAEGNPSFKLVIDLSSMEEDPDPDLSRHREAIVTLVDWLSGEFPDVVSELHSKDFADFVE